MFFVFIHFEKLLRSSVQMHTGIEFRVMAALIHLIEIIRYIFFPSRNKTLRLFMRKKKTVPFPLRIIEAIVNTVAN